MAIWPYLLFGLVAGAMLPFQAGINAQLSQVVGSPLRAALVSFAVGTVALLILVAAAARGWGSAREFGGAPWWVWIGGLLGAFYVAGSIVVAPKIGAVTLVAVILGGQAVESLVVDHFGWVGFDAHPMSLGRVLGLALVGTGVALVRFT